MLNKWLWISASILAILILIGGILWYQKTPGELDTFAQCLDEQGTKFYGAFWCPHCQKQKALFGKSEKYLPYIECSSPDGRKQLDICIEAGIKGYPTWEFSNTERLSGEIPLETLAEKTGCTLP